MSYIGPPLSAEELEARTGRRSWEEATLEELEAMTRKDRELYREERAARAKLAAYIADIREQVEQAGGAVAPAGLLAVATVTRVCNTLGAIALATCSGRPQVLADGNSVSYYAEAWTSPDNLAYRREPVIDPLLEALADALGCAWRWREDKAIELEPAETADVA